MQDFFLNDKVIQRDRKQNKETEAEKAEDVIVRGKRQRK